MNQIDNCTGLTLRRALLLEQGGVIALVGAGGKTSLMFRLARELASSGDTVLTTTTTKISELETVPDFAPVMSGAVRNILSRAKELLSVHKHITAARDKYNGKLVGYTAEDIDHLWQSGLFRWIIVEADGAARRPLKVPDAHEPVIPRRTHCVIGIAGLTAFKKPLSDQWVFRMALFKKITGLRSEDRITAAAIAASLVQPEGVFKGSPQSAGRVVFLNQADTPERLEAGRQVIASLSNQARKIGIQKAILGQLLCDPPVVEVFDF